MLQSNAWVDKYRPNSISECFLPEAAQKQLQKIIKTGDVPSLFFSGPAGIGKTSAALALCKDLDLEYMMINASLHGNIDTVRTDIQQFASSISFNGKKKVVILDEADGLTAAAQASLRAAINEYTDNCAFILTANYRNKIIDPLISRFVEIDFLFSKNEKPKLAKSLFQFIIERLKEESVQYDVKCVQQFIIQRLSASTDIRKTLIEAQKIAQTGVFDTNSLINVDESRLNDLIQIIKTKDFQKIRTWVGENSDISFEDILNFIYTNLDKLATTPSSIPAIIVILNEHQYKNAFVIDKEINTAAMIAEISMAR